MSVLTCDRIGCNHVMCDTYVDGIGYICSDCQSEFKSYLEEAGIIRGYDEEIREHLEHFMFQFPKKHSVGNKLSINEFFGSYTRDISRD